MVSGEDTERIADTINEAEAMTIIFPLLLKSVEEQPGSEGLVLCDTQLHPWLPADDRAPSRNNLKPDAVLIHTAFTRLTVQAKTQSHFYKPAHRKTHKHIRVVIESKHEKCRSNEAMGECVHYAQALRKSCPLLHVRVALCVHLSHDAVYLT
jgi:hypothetical protein